MATYESVEPLESMSSLRGHVGSLASMPSKLMGLLFLMLLIISCHSHRQTVETIALSRRYQQQCLQVNDTMWQSFNLHFEGLSMELTVDTARSSTKTSVLKVLRADLNIDKHSRSTVNALSMQDDTLVFNHSEETLDTTNMTHSNQQPKPNRFLLGMLFPLALIGLVLIVLIFIRTRKH